MGGQGGMEFLMQRLESIYPIEVTEDLSLVDKWCAIDVETGGLDCMRHALLSVAVFIPGEGTETIYIRPEGEVTAEALAINHIDLQDCAHGCSRDWAGTWFARKVCGRAIVGHSVVFDLGFILWRLYRLPPSPESAALMGCMRVVDTYRLAKSAWPDAKHDLATSAQQAGLDIVAPSRLHTAGYDAELCGGVMAYFMDNRGSLMARGERQG